jgi:hypothetical protein
MSAYFVSLRKIYKTVYCLVWQIRDLHATMWTSFRKGIFDYKKEIPW